MIRLRPACAPAVLLLLAGLLPALRGDEKPAGEKKAAEEWLVDRALTVSPAPAAVPALRYRLFPSTFELKDGNAVPIYLRFAHERGDARKKELIQKPGEWNKLPLKELPLGEVKRFLDGYRYNFRQLELGARRKRAEWEYTLDAGNPIGILLPDVQEMRTQAPLLVLKARVEIAEGRYADALRTFETGFSFSHQISNAPFLINDLVAIAVASIFSDALVELIEQPGAPNLYWALTVIPRPFVDLRRANEFEQNILELQFPDLADLDRPRSAEEWDATLKRVRQAMSRVLVQAGEPAPKPGTRANDPADKSPDLPAARKYLIETAGMPADRVRAMPAAQVLLLYLSRYYHQLRDEVFKLSYLPYAEARPLFAEAQKRLKSLPPTEAAWLVHALLPALEAVNRAQVRIDRKLAALRTIEALRLHAAAHGGRLPDKLADITAVPVPDNPGTGKPFEYRLDGQTATLISRVPGESPRLSALRYRITVRP